MGDMKAVISRSCGAQGKISRSGRLFGGGGAAFGSWLWEV